MVDKNKIEIRQVEQVKVPLPKDNGHYRPEVIDQVVKAAVGYIFNPPDEKMIEVTNLPLDQIRPLAMTLTIGREIKTLCEYVVDANKKYKDYRFAQRSIWLPIDREGNLAQIENKEQFRLYAEKVGLLWEQDIDVRTLNRYKPEKKQTVKKEEVKEEKVEQPKVEIIKEEPKDIFSVMPPDSMSEDDEITAWNEGRFEVFDEKKEDKKQKIKKNKSKWLELIVKVISYKPPKKEKQSSCFWSFNLGKKKTIKTVSEQFNAEMEYYDKQKQTIKDIQLEKAFIDFKRRQEKFMNEYIDDSDFEMDIEKQRLMMTEFVFHYCQARRSLRGDLMLAGITVSRDQIMSQGDKDNLNLFDARQQ